MIDKSFATLRDLGFDSDRLDRIYRATPGDPQGGISPADYLDLKSQMSGYGDIAAYASSGMSLSEPGKPAETASGHRISANLFSTLGIELQPSAAASPAISPPPTPRARGAPCRSRTPGSPRAVRASSTC